MKDLKSIRMEKGLLYETIITTKNEDNIPNAAPIGVICKDTLEIVLYLYEGTHTLQNIKSNPHFIVNITKDPLIFANSTLGDLSTDYFEKCNDNYYIKNADAFFIATINSIKEVEKEDNIGKSRVNIIRANVDEIIIKNEPVEPLNRAIFAIVESLVYFSRIEIVNEETKKIYSKRIKEMSRLVSRVGGIEHKKAMNNILKHVENK
ncbi:DUF447 domain-containing protein [Methanobacterium oryzae]|uniref:DUF447 domain-containing protein n=1 Tax=Methanobacterium oryzae TaxID=69540 RepID=UPI003D224A20